MTVFKFACCLALAFIFSSQAIFAQQNTGKFVAGELLVKYKSGTASGAAFSANRQNGAAVVEEFPELKWQRIKLPFGVSVEQAIASYKNFAGIESVQPNYIYKLAATPNDTRFAELYGLTKISAPSAWDLTTGSANTVVAVIDTGVNYAHEDLAANMWKNPGEIQGNGVDDDGNGFIDDYYGYDFFYDRADPMDENGHGTHVSGTIGAVGNNNLGIVGVNWNVRLMAIKIYDADGLGTTSAMLVNSYNYVRLMKERGVNIRVTNNSYSGCTEACGYDQATKDALDAMGDAGILNVFAAGNDATNIDNSPKYPASYNSPSLLSVAASTSSDAKAGFSNFGTKGVDIAAPGSGILSTYFNQTKYISFSGTSMASPHAAGAAALLSSYNPQLSAASLKATLMNSVDPLPQWNGVVKTGGRLNVNNALRNQTVCNFAFDRQSQNVFPEGGTFTINVTAAQNCDYPIKSDAFFVAVTSGEIGSGNGTITFEVERNSSLARQGKITIGDKVFNVNQNGNGLSAGRAFLDFDGDKRTDYVALQNSGGNMLWHKRQSLLGYQPFNFGLYEDIAVPALYDVDSKNDLAVWRSSNGTFYVLSSIDNTFQAVQFGLPGDDPTITQDFDADGKADFAVTRRVNGKLIWYILGTTSGFRAFQFGNETDKPLRGDFDADGKADLAVYRPASDFPANTFYVLKSSDGKLLVVQFGNSATDKIVPADYDGDGKTDIAVWRETTGVWYYLKSSDGSFNAFQFGASGDLPTPGDYDGDGRTDFSVWRANQNPSDSGVFYVYSVLSGNSTVLWGDKTMKITANSLAVR